MKRQKQKIILLIDNAGSYVYTTKLSHIRIEFLKPNMTSHIQPLDAGIIHAFKAHYQKLYIFWVLDNDKEGKEDIYKINQLQGMRLAMQAWGEISSQTVSNCWKHAKILSHDLEAPEDINQEAQAARNELQEALDKLVASENVTQKTIATVSDLLDVEAEVETEEEWTLEDLIEQHRFDEQEAAGYHVDELDPEPEPEPLIT